ncbi:MAG: radical SAM protein [Candidatus Lokiarchaeota archaeon]|nr:radical SAM protein [Candidatus Lokiarchaeota archaeon]
MDVNKIRVSIGSAGQLGLVSNIKIADSPTTCYLMTYVEGKCAANCGFCPQARESESSMDRLSRVTWPAYSFSEFLIKIKYMVPSKRFKRICLQTLNYPDNFKDICEIITELKNETSIPISIAIPPMDTKKLRELRLLGVERVGIALDAATRQVFEKVKGKLVKGPYSWKTHYEALLNATKIFREGAVSTHIIVGLGDSFKEIMELIFELRKYEIIPALFAFTPIKGTYLEDRKPPDLLGFRKVQLGRYLLLNKSMTLKDITFNKEGDIISFNINKADLLNIVDDGIAFMTTGCPDCNRPYYTSKPSGPIYNYPRKLTKSEKDQIYDQLKSFTKF